MESQVKTEQDRRKKLKHKEFMQHLKMHKEEFSEWHKKKLKDLKKVISQAKTTIELKKKDEEEKEKKKKVARLNILKTQNIEKYI